MLWALLATKLVTIITTSMLVIDASKESAQEIKDLDQISYIYYFISLWKDRSKAKIMVLINFKRKINAINFIYMAKLGFQV